MTAITRASSVIDGHSPLISRRLLLGSAFAAASSAVVNDVLAASTTATPAATDLSAAQTLRLMMKLQTSLSAATVPWFYSGSIYAVRSATAPLHLFEFEGTEIYWVHPQADDVWLVSASTLTFYRDISTGNYLDEFINPLTQQRVEVKPNVLRMPPGASMKYSIAGIEAFGQVAPWNAHAYRGGKLLWLQTSRAAQAGPQPSMEVSTLFADAAEIDAATQQAASHFASTTFSPWSRWLGMADREGHLVWHAAGRKLASYTDMPSDYRSRAERLAPLHFTDPYLITPALPKS